MSPDDMRVEAGALGRVLADDLGDAGFALTAGAPAVAGGGADVGPGRESIGQGGAVPHAEHASPGPAPADIPAPWLAGTPWPHHWPSLQSGWPPVPPAATTATPTPQAADGHGHDHDHDHGHGHAHEHAAGQAAPSAEAGTLPYFIVALDSGARWGPLGQGQVLDYSFVTSLITTEVGFQPYSAAQMDKVRDALAHFAQQMDVVFQEVPDAVDVDIRFFRDDLTSAGYGGYGGYAYYPRGGDIHINVDYAFELDTGLNDLLLHEIGHALGLSHPYDDPYALPGGGTIMNYDPFPERALGLYDLATLHRNYGIADDQRGGDDRYDLADVYVWDGGGLDLFDGSAFAVPLFIDLHPGSWLYAGTLDTADLFAGDQAFLGFDTWIEAALGGSAADEIHGNELDNELDGGAGIDTLVGAEGDDRYMVDHPQDRVVERAGEGLDTVHASANHTLPDFVEDLVLSGGAVKGTGNGLDNALLGSGASNVLSGLGGNDTLSGRGGNDQLYGGGGADRLDGGAGADLMDGGAGNDVYVVDHVGDRLVDAGGHDTVESSIDFTLPSGIEVLWLTGQAVAGTGNGLGNRIDGNASANVIRGEDGDDRLAGASGADQLFGGHGNDQLDGGQGNDVLTGGAGIDRLTGGTGNDRFVIDSLSGSDTIADFTSGADKLVVSQATIPIRGGDTVVANATTIAGPGGFAVNAELVVVTGNIAGGITAAKAAAAIGSATASYSVGAARLFMVDNGVNSALYLFTAANANAAVEAAELTLLATLAGTGSTTVNDLLFGP